MLNKWALCLKGEGYYHEIGIPENRVRKFKVNSVGMIQKENKDSVVIWLIGSNETWTVPINDIEYIDVFQTGNKYDKKICNICHCLLPVSQFAKNQNNKHGLVRRPSCIRCRTDIDKPSSQKRSGERYGKKAPSKR